MGIPAPLSPVSSPDHGPDPSNSPMPMPLKAARAPSWQTVMEQRLSRAGRSCAHTAGNFRMHLRDLAENRPFHLLVTIAAVSFVTGIALRIWRSSRYE